MAFVKSPEEITALREAGRRLGEILRALSDAVGPGVSTQELNDLAEALIRDGGDTPAFLNYAPAGATYPYPATLCVGVNDQVVHGIPSPEQVLAEGDIVLMDLGLCHRGVFVDAARTVPVGEIDENAQRLLKVTKQALDAGICAARAGGWTGDISAAIEQTVRPHGFGIPEELGGHGVGHAIHEPPFIQNIGKKRSGTRLKPGMVLAIEPIINEGTKQIVLDADGYTYRTKDGRRSAEFEDTILVTDGKPENLTRV
jgi:methionyl aminopeptidase